MVLRIGRKYFRAFAFSFSRLMPRMEEEPRGGFIQREPTFVLRHDALGYREFIIRIMSRVERVGRVKHRWLEYS